MPHSPLNRSETGQAHVRLVVTGHDVDGRATVIQDGPVSAVPSALLGGGDMVRLWAFDPADDGPMAGTSPDAAKWIPAPGAGRFGIFSVPPKTHGTPPHIDGMHATPTVDFVVILAGELTLLLDEGPDLKLQTGDALVQNGTRHAWANESDSLAIAAVVLLGVYESR